MYRNATELRENKFKSIELPDKDGLDAFQSTCNESINIINDNLFIEFWKRIDKKLI